MITVIVLIASLYNPLSELKCISDNVYYEARGESVSGMIAVAHTTKNRVYNNKFDNNICDVVHENKQFSWTNKNSNFGSFEFLKYIQAVNVSNNVLLGKIKDNTNGSLYFHTKKVKPIWRHKLKRTVSIGNHIFYK